MSKILLFKSSFSVKLQRIMEISRILPTVPANFAKSTLAQCFQVPDHWQRTPWNWSESYRFHAFRQQFLRTTQNSLNLHPWPVNTSEPSELQENTANHQNSAPFAPPPGEHRKFCMFRTQQNKESYTFIHLLCIIYMYAHIFAPL